MTRSTTSLRIESDRIRSPIDDVGVPIPVRQGDIQRESRNEPASSIRRPGEGSALEEILRWLTRSLAAMAVVSSFALLCVGATPMLSALPAYISRGAFRCWLLLKNVPLSALPLLLAGCSYLVLQAILRPRPLELLKRVMLGAAFLLWGVVQLLPASDLANELGNVVIALYVIDLGLIIWTDLEKYHPRLAG
jgi:hypothetical protein